MILDDGMIDANSSLIAKNVFEWLIAPMTADEFYGTYAEKKPLYIPRGNLTLIYLFID